MNNKSDTQKAQNKDIFVSLASLEDIETEKDILHSQCNIDKFVAELKDEKLTQDRIIAKTLIRCLKPFSDTTLNFSDMEYTGLLYEDLKYHVLLATYYNIQYLLAPKKNLEEFLHFSIKELSDIAIENDKKRILRDIRRKQGQWYLPLLNLTETKKLKNIPCFLPFIFKFFEYKTNATGRGNALNNYQHNIVNSNSTYISSLNRKLKETINLLCAPYQAIFNTTFSSTKNSSERKANFFLYYYKLERGYGLDLLYDSFEFMLHEYNEIQWSDNNFSSTEQEIISFFLLLQKLPNVMTRSLLIKSYYAEFKKRPSQLTILSDFYTLFEKVFLLTIIELFNRKLSDISDLLFKQLDNTLVLYPVSF